MFWSSQCPLSAVKYLNFIKPCKVFEVHQTMREKKITRTGHFCNEGASEIDTSVPLLKVTKFLTFLIMSRLRTGKYLSGIPSIVFFTFLIGSYHPKYPTPRHALVLGDCVESCISWRAKQGHMVVRPATTKRLQSLQIPGKERSCNYPHIPRVSAEVLRKNGVSKTIVDFIDA